jgi:hypothetical protein
MNDTTNNQTATAIAVASSDGLGDMETYIQHITQHHHGFDETTLHIARQWMRAAWGQAMQQSYGDSFRMDWMENYYRGVETYPMDDQDGEPTRQLWIAENGGIQMVRPTIREAIDAAITQMSPNEKGRQ